MKRSKRIGAQIGPYDPFWVQVQEAVQHKAQQFGVELIPIEMAGNPDTFSSREQTNLLEELLAQKLDALICWNLPNELIRSILKNDLPAIYLAESNIRHPLFVSPAGLYEAGKMVGHFLAEKLNGRGRILCVGGLSEQGGENGQSRLSGFSDALQKFSGIDWEHFPSYWRYDQAYPQIQQALLQFGSPINAIFGLSDSLALASRDALQKSGILDERVLIAGVNGDPQALAAIADGSFSATVETSASEFGTRAVELAFQAAQGETLPEHYGYLPRLITGENVNDAIKRKLIDIASLPSRLVGVNRQLEREQITQLETSTAINRRVGALLDRRELCKEIANLIRSNYGYDHVQFFLYHKENKTLILEQVDDVAYNEATPPVDPLGPLQEVIHTNEAIFIPDTLTNTQYPTDPLWPATRTRVILPIRIDDEILGLLDLHSQHFSHHLRTELIGLQSLADQLGIAMRNAELYAEAVEARAMAEKANHLKTRLLANVGHELRSPLNIIMGYSELALQKPNPYHMDLPARLVHDQQHIYQSSEHLNRIINDLLDLSRAEIDELELFPEYISAKTFFEDVFHSIADTADSQISWKLELPKRLPVLYGDPVRLRQILLNLLSNARKFTKKGEIVLGAKVEPPHLHLWVKDTGLGIPADQQEQIFEPFISADLPGRRSRRSRRSEGIGLGLSITRRLVALHYGAMSLESRVGQGSIFHVYLPLPSLTGKIGYFSTMTNPAILLISAAETPPAKLSELSLTQGLSIVPVKKCAEMVDLLQKHRPCALAWDIAHAAAEDWAIIENLRGYPDYCHIPFILYGRDAEEAPAGFTSILTKPVNAKTLIEYIHSLKSVHRPILIVDDDPEARRLYRDLVHEAVPGYKIIEAKDGAEALEILSGTVPSLVLLDLVMPKIDGFTVLDRIRSSPKISHVPVLVLSGKLITQADIQKLDYAKVIFQNKDLLSNEAALGLLQKTLGTEAGFLAQPTSKLVKQALAFLYQNYRNVFSRQEIARAVGVSENYLTHIFCAEVGMTPWEYLNRLRTQKAKELLLQSSDSVTMIACHLGFYDPAYFSRVFRKYTGLSPQAFRSRPSQ